MSDIPSAHPVPDPAPDPLDLLVDRCLYVDRDPDLTEIDELVLGYRKRAFDQLFDETGVVGFYPLDVNQAERAAMLSRVQARLDAVRQQVSLDRDTLPAPSSNRSGPRL